MFFLSPINLSEVWLNNLETWHIILFAIGLLFLWLLTQRWFWLLVLGVGGLASAFATLASIFHFQILGALGFFFLQQFSGSYSAS